MRVYVPFIVFSSLIFFPSDRTFVHEWAHFRWGVFDEYNNNEKFYLSNGKPQAVRYVSSDVTSPKLFQSATNLSLKDF